jgi:hypothetical protein
MRLIRIKPLPILQPFIEKLWVFESDHPMPNEDMKLIVPNGLIKMVIPYRNGLSGKMQGWYHLSKVNSITLIGMTDIPSIVDDEVPGPSGTIGVEFSPMGAYRFFRFSQGEIRNQIHPLTDILGRTAKLMEEQIAAESSVNKKIQRLQSFLVRQLEVNSPDQITDYCLRTIVESKGKIGVGALEKKTGYSSRWLNMKFIERVGVSPKNFASIVRFQHFYQAWARAGQEGFFQKNFYDYYYDQSHFIKDFKRFTGYAPTRFHIEENEFGRIFYKE